jgi:hypothetical protein
MKATNSGGEVSRTETVPVQSRGQVSAEQGAATDDLVIILLPRATWDATAALGRRLGEATGGEPLHPTAVMGLALKRLQEDTDRKLGTK